MTPSTQTTTPLRTALHTAIEAARLATEAWEATAPNSDDERSAAVVMDAADEEVITARSALRASDEPRSYTVRDEGADETITATSMADAEEQAREWLRNGDYGEVERTIWCDARIEGEDGDESSVTVTIDPTAPKCTDGERDSHDWQSPHALVGGLKENPGVWGHGGGVVIHEACLHCGCGRVTDTWAQCPGTSKQGLRSVNYEAGKYAGEVASADLDLSTAAQECVEETGIDPLDDVEAIRTGKHTAETLLGECLDGADEDRVEGWREYVAEIVRVASL